MNADRIRDSATQRGIGREWHESGLHGVINFTVLGGW
jgi:hypothetical protein